MRDREERGVIKSKRTKTAPHSRVHDMYEEYCCTQVDQSSVGNPELKIAATYKQLPNPSASGYLATGGKTWDRKKKTGYSLQTSSRASRCFGAQLPPSSTDRSKVNVQ